MFTPSLKIALTSWDIPCPKHVQTCPASNHSLWYVQFSLCVAVRAILLTASLSHFTFLHSCSRLSLCHLFFLSFYVCVFGFHFLLSFFFWFGFLPPASAVCVLFQHFFPCSALSSVCFARMYSARSCFCHLFFLSPYLDCVLFTQPATVTFVPFGLSVFVSQPLGSFTE